MDELTLIGVMQVLAGGGSVAIVLALLSKYGERLAAYQRLDKLGKQIVAFVLSAAISLGAYALVKYVPDSAWVAAQEWFAIIAIVASAVFGSSILHFFLNKVSPAVGLLAAQAKLLDQGKYLVLNVASVEPLPIPQDLPTSFPQAVPERGPAAPPQDTEAH